MSKPIARDKHVGMKNNDGGGGHKGDGKDGNGHKGKGNGGGRYGAMGGYKGVSRHDAKKLVNADIHDLLRQLHHEVKQTRRETRRAVKQENTQYGRTQNDLNGIYSNTGQFLQSQNEQMKNNFTGANQYMDAAHQMLSQQLGQQGQQSQADVNGELSRLGMTQAGNPQQFMNQIQADQQNANVVNGMMDMNNHANLGAMNMGAQQVGNLLAGMNSAGQAAALNQALQGHNDALTGIRNDGRDSLSDVRNAMRDARAGRGDAINVMLQQMAQQGWGQYMDNRSQNFNEWLQRQQLGLDRRSLNLQAQQNQQGLQQQNAYYSTGAGLYQNQLGNTYGGNPGGGPNNHPYHPNRHRKPHGAPHSITEPGAHIG